MTERKKLREGLEKAGYSVKKAAEALDISPVTLSYILAGTRNPGPELAAQLAALSGNAVEAADLVSPRRRMQVALLSKKGAA